MKIIFSKTDYQKKQFCQIKTAIIEGANRKSVQKSILTFVGKEHLLQIEANRHQIIKDGVLETPKLLTKSIKDSLEYEFISGQNFEERLIELFEKNLDKTTGVWCDYQAILQKLAHAPSNEDKSKFTTYFKSDANAFGDKWIASYYYDILLSNLIKHDSKVYYVDFESWFDFAVPVDLVLCRTLWQVVVGLQPYIRRSISNNFPAILLIGDIYCPVIWLEALKITPEFLMEIENINEEFYPKVLKQNSVFYRSYVKSKIETNPKTNLLSIEDEQKQFKDELNRSKDELRQTKESLMRKKIEIDALATLSDQKSGLINARIEQAAKNDVEIQRFLDLSKEIHIVNTEIATTNQHINRLRTSKFYRLWRLFNFIKKLIH